VISKKSVSLSMTLYTATLRAITCEGYISVYLTRSPEKKLEKPNEGGGSMFKTFVERCLEGTAQPGDIDDWVDAWHESAPGSEDLTLDEYLGFTPEEGAIWARYGSRLGEILENRRRNRQPA